jgi:iron complex transport system permease protein
MMRSGVQPFILLLLILAGVLCLSLIFGSVAIPLPHLIASFRPGASTIETEPDAFTTILFQIRLPRIILTALTGAALAGSGSAYQGVFRNPLADPYLIGVASGAGLGAVLAMSFSWSYNVLGLLIVPIAAFIGAILTVAAVYSMAKVGKTIPTTNLILAGVAISSFATALTSFLMLRSQGELRRAMVWLLGGAAMGGWQPVLAILPYVIIGSIALVLSGHTLNVLQFGDEQAQQLGINVEKVRLRIIVAASLTAAAAVSFSGIIGFIGLMVPHLIRLLFGSDYRRLIPLSIIGGAIMLLLADILARVLLAPQELPVGIVTAMTGSPFFLVVLRRSKNQAMW